MLRKADQYLIVFEYLNRFGMPLWPSIRKVVEKFISNLTVTMDSWQRRSKKYIYTNFDAINTLILRQKGGNFMTIRVNLLRLSNRIS